MLSSSIKIMRVDEIDSTNKFLKDNYKDLANITVLRTNFQTKGMGQFERTWESNKNENLLFSILLKDIKLNEINTIKTHVIETLLVVLKTFGLKGIFKEPNDIYVNDSKILGILIETKVNINQVFDYVVIGIGININQTIFINDNATSFKLLKDKTFDLDEIFSTLLNIFFRNNKLN